jgi:uncharacterized membrane protein
MHNISFTPLEILFGLLITVGIALFVVACWRNIKRNN